MAEADGPGAVDAFGTRIEAGDHVVPIGDPTRPVLVVDADPAGGLVVRRSGREYPLRPRHVRVVTIRDVAGERLAAGDIVRGVGAADDAPTYVVRSVQHAAHLVVLDGLDAGDPPIVALPATLVRVGAVVLECDTVVDPAGVVLAVLACGPDDVLVAPVAGGPAVTVPRQTLRRVDDERGAGARVEGDGSFTVPALDDDPAMVDVLRLLAGEDVPGLASVLPLQRRVG